MVQLPARSLGLLLLLPLLAGCADDAPADDVDEAAPAPLEPEPHILTGTDDFGWVIAAGIPTTGADTQIGSTNAATIDVPEGAKSLTVNVTWTCAPVDCTLHVYLDAPRAAAGGPVPLVPAGHAAHTTGTSMASLSVDDPVPGEWWAAVHADSLAPMASGTFTWEIVVPGDDAGMMAEHAHGGA